MNHILVLILLMAAAGILGGIINYFFSKESDKQGVNLSKCIIIGIGASFLVPLFLNMISSSLIKESNAEPELLLVIVGFCLIASISSRSFISSLSAQVLKELKEARDAREEDEKEDLETYEAFTQKDVMKIIKENIGKLQQGDRKTLGELFELDNKNNKWGALPPGARRSAGKHFYSLVKSGEILSLKPDEKNSYGVQAYTKI